MNIPGLNIQWPISELILSGTKTVETRTYPLPKKYINVPLLFIETPGKSGNFKARGTAIIFFEEPFKYKSKKEFYLDFDRHQVDKDSQWAWDKPKWGWPIRKIEVFKKPFEINFKRGITFTQRCHLPQEVHAPK